MHQVRGMWGKASLELRGGVCGVPSAALLGCGSSLRHGRTMECAGGARATATLRDRRTDPGGPPAAADRKGARGRERETSGREAPPLRPRHPSEQHLRSEVQDARTEFSTELRPS